MIFRWSNTVKALFNMGDCTCSRSQTILSPKAPTRKQNS